MPPISMPIVPKFENPHNAYVAITRERSLMCVIESGCSQSANCLKATISFATTFLPNSSPTFRQSAGSMPITRANGAKT